MMKKPNNKENKKSRKITEPLYIRDYSCRDR